MKKALLYAILFGLAALLIQHWSRVRPPPSVTPFNALRETAAPALADDLDEQSLHAALDQSIEYFKKTTLDEAVQFGRDPIPRRLVLLSLIDIQEKLRAFGLGEMFHKYLAGNYRFYQTSSREPLFTGYYEARLRGSLTQSEKYRYPLYTRPDDMYEINLKAFSDDERLKGLSLRGRIGPQHRILPYFSRAEIDYGQHLAGRGLELVWVDDQVELFFLHIQGSGVITLDDGSTLRVNYADRNGHSYRPIGKLLSERGILTPDTATMQGIRSYLAQHPEEVREIFSYNPSYVFFRRVEEGPIGSIGVKLTALRSIATDSRLFPKGAPVVIQTEKPVFGPDGRVLEWQRFTRLALNQDTGGAIRGPGRVDLFAGLGPEAEAVAGHMKQPGTFYFLLKKN